MTEKEKVVLLLRTQWQVQLVLSWTVGNNQFGVAFGVQNERRAGVIMEWIIEWKWIMLWICIWWNSIDRDFSAFSNVYLEMNAHNINNDESRLIEIFTQYMENDYDEKNIRADKSIQKSDISN